MRDSGKDLGNVPTNADTGSSSYKTSVLIVGAGPTGLLLAAELRRRAVPCHLIDARPGPLHWDRATVVHPRSLELFESLGLAEKFLNAGCRQRAVKIHSGGEVIGRMDLSDSGSIYGFNVGVSEETTESILTDYLRQQGGELHRSSQLVGLTSRPDGILAEIERDGERYQMYAQWLVGCDGVHSPTRELSGIGFDGHDILKPWAVFDATLQGWTESFETTFVYFESLPLILTAIPGRRWRAYLRPSSEQSDLVADAASTLGIYAPGVSFVDVENPTRFWCHTKVATRYQSGRVLLAGDAAHVCSPDQGHGMNCGLQDAFNLAWKLALVHHRVADAGLLGSYEVERRPVADTVAQSGDAFENALSLTDQSERDGRDQDIKATLADPKTRHHEIVAETELNIDYSQSPIVGGNYNSQLAPGQRLPGTIPVLRSDNGHRFLHELTHRAGHTLMLLAGPAAHNTEFESLFEALHRATIDSMLFEAVAAVGVRSGSPIQTGELEPSAVDLLGLEGISLLIVRPDGYVGLRADRNHLDALERYRVLLHAPIPKLPASF